MTKRALGKDGKTPRTPSEEEKKNVKISSLPEAVLQLRKGRGGGALEKDHRQECGKIGPMFVVRESKTTAYYRGKKSRP